MVNTTGPVYAGGAGSSPAVTKFGWKIRRKPVRNYTGERAKTPKTKRKHELCLKVGLETKAENESGTA